MSEQWQWDGSLFRGSAVYYGRGRLPYAKGFAEVVASEFDLDGTGRLLDVGCGPGIIALEMARYFGEAVGVDPDEDMLAEADRQASLREVTNVRWVRGLAEDLPLGLGEFRVVTFGNSFHWTDRDRVAVTVKGMLEPGGVFVHLSDWKNRPPLPSVEAPPYDEIGDLVRRYLGPDRRAGQGIRNDSPDREDLVLARAGFVDFRRHIVPAGQTLTRTRDDVVAWVFSHSGSAPHLFGDRLNDFERDLRVLLSEDAYEEHVPATEIMTWRTP